MARKTQPLKLQDFLARLDKNVQTTEQLLVRVFHRVAFDAAENIIVGGKYAPGTPVDTGFARASWYVVLNSAQGQAASDAVGSHLTHDKSGMANLDTSLSVIGAAGLTDVIWLLNNAPYIEALEYGHSQQAPQGMVRLTLAAGQQLLDDAMRVEQERAA
jgi:hypothetical protein